MSLLVCKICKRLYGLQNDGDHLGRIEGVCGICEDEGPYEKRSIFKEKKKKPSPSSWDDPGEGDRD